MNGGTKNMGLNDPQTMRRTIVKMANRIDILEARLCEAEGSISAAGNLVTRLLEITDHLTGQVKSLKGGE